jgi:hypothetical protein
VEVGQADVGAMLIGKAELWGNGSGNKHSYRLRAFVVGGVDFVGPVSSLAAKPVLAALRVIFCMLCDMD